MAVDLSEAEKVYIIHGAEDNLRSDGRRCGDFRPITLETGLLSNTTGSARVRIGTSDVLVGIKADVETPSPHRRNQGRIQFFVDCSANAAPDFEGRGGEGVSNGVVSALSAAYDDPHALDWSALCLLPAKFAWTLYADIVLLEMGGSLYDAISVGVKAALFDTRIPRVNIVHSEDGQADLEMTEDIHDCWRLDVSSAPLFVTVNKIGSANVVDATQEEEACSLCSLIVGIGGGKGGHVTTSRQEGRGSLSPESIADMLSLALTTGQLLQETLTAKLKKEDSIDNRQIKGFLA